MDEYKIITKRDIDLVRVLFWSAVIIVLGEIFRRVRG